jgi:pimeloyl-ACP methyl ester carboxylesterase
MLRYKKSKEIFFITEDNTRLNGIFYKNGEGLPTAIYFGGNGEDSLNFIDIAKEIKEYNFLVFNYRGYGLSEGEPSRDSILNDAKEIYDKFLDKNSVAIGRSLGSSVATYLASQREIDRLLIITPFDSIKSMGEDIFKLPLSPILKHNFDTSKYIKDITTPTFMLVVLRDEIVPKKHSDNLKKSIKNLVIYREIEGTHNFISFSKEVDFIRESCIYL